MPRIANLRDLLAGLLFLAFAAVLAHDALLLPVGTARRMGPGYFPLALALILAGLGLAIALGSLRRGQGGAIGALAWRGVAMVILSILAFAATVRGFGFVPAVALSVGLATFASPEFRLRTALALVAFLVVFCWAIFIRGLGMPVALFG